MNHRPAVLGGTPLFAEPVRFAYPTIDGIDGMLADMRTVMESGQLTDGRFVRRLEERVTEAFGVGHAVAVSSNTIGLMLVVQALDPGGPVLVPSFTFSATAHAVRWNGLPLIFGDCDPDTWCLRPRDVSGDPALIIGVHVSGMPCDVEGLAATASEHGAKLIFDAAHGGGTLVQSNHGLTPVGRFGEAEVFSLTPTKVLGGAEGGLVTTDDAHLAARLRVARNYGNPGDYDTLFAGLNARMSELHAVLALGALDHLEERVCRRNRIAGRYRAGLQSVPGVGFQQVPEGARSSYKDFTVFIDAAQFGCSRDAVTAALDAEGVPTRRYYSPPVHLQQAYGDVETPALPVTERLGDGVVTLPMWSHMPDEVADDVAAAVARIQSHAAAVEASG